MPDDKKQVSFLPFNALNEFMRPDYRQTVVLSVLQSLPDHPEYQDSVNRLVKKLVQIPGFRNSLQAPVRLKLKPTIAQFEKNQAVTGAILAAWAGTRPDLQQRVYDLLINRGWEILPIEADRTKLPGFLTTWPTDEDFAKINEAFIQANPDFQTTQDDVSLMAVWLSGRLPLEKEEQNTEETEEV